MKNFFAYAILVIGIPNYIGVILGVLFMPLAWPFSHPLRMHVIQILNFPKGLISIGLTLLLFKLIGTPAGLPVL